MDSPTGQVAAPLLGAIASGISPRYGGAAANALYAGLNVANNAQRSKMQQQAQQAYLDQQKAALAQQQTAQAGNSSLLSNLYLQSQSTNQDASPIAPLTRLGAVLSPGRPVPIASDPASGLTLDASGNDQNMGTQTDAATSSPLSSVVSIGGPHAAGRLATLLAPGATSRAIAAQKNGTGILAPVTANDVRIGSLLNGQSPAAGSQFIEGLMSRQMQQPPLSVTDAQKLTAGLPLLPGQSVQMPTAGGGKVSFATPNLPNVKEPTRSITTDELAIVAGGGKTGYPPADNLGQQGARNALQLRKQNDATGRTHQQTVTDPVDGLQYRVTWDANGNEVNRVPATNLAKGVSVAGLASLRAQARKAIAEDTTRLNPFSPPTADEIDNYLATVNRIDPATGQPLKPGAGPAANRPRGGTQPADGEVVGGTNRGVVVKKGGKLVFQPK